MITPYKVRLRLALFPHLGKWYACWVDDLRAPRYGVTQAPVHKLDGAHGATPKEAYQNLMEARQ